MLQIYAHFILLNGFNTALSNDVNSLLLIYPAESTLKLGRQYFLWEVRKSGTFFLPVGSANEPNTFVS